MRSNQSPYEAFSKAVTLTGGPTAFGRAVGCSQSNISQLLSAKRPLPARYVLRAEAATGVSRHDLRPDLYPRESPSLAEQAAA